MPESPQLPPRPLPPRRPGAALHAWVEWFGLGRLIAGAVAVVVVAAGALWLLQAPPTPVEANLPVATGSVPVATIVPPAAQTSATSVPVTAPAASAVVHVAGAVQQPGVYELPPGSRVADAVSSGGGATADGDLDGLNLAAPVADGERIYVPRIGEVDPAGVPSGAATSAANASDAAATAGPLDLNTAEADQLESLPGVGPATAVAIVDDRTRNGPFASVDDLDRVAGIGPAKLDSIRDLVTV